MKIEKYEKALAAAPLDAIIFLTQITLIGTH